MSPQLLECTKSVHIITAAACYEVLALAFNCIMKGTSYMNIYIYVFLSLLPFQQLAFSQHSRHSFRKSTQKEAKLSQGEADDRIVLSAGA